FSLLQINLYSLYLILVSLLHLSSFSFPTRRSSDLEHLSRHLRRGCRRRDRSPPRAGLRERRQAPRSRVGARALRVAVVRDVQRRDRKSTRLNSSHVKISYAVFCL